MRILHNTQANQSFVERNKNYASFRLTIIALTLMFSIGVPQFESVSFGDERDTGYIHRPVVMDHSNTATHERNSLDAQNSHRRALQNRQEQLIGSQTQNQQMPHLLVPHVQTELSSQAQLARKQQLQAFNHAQAGTVQQAQALEDASPQRGYAPPQQYYAPKQQSQSILRGQEINNPLPKTATERAWELAAENINLRDELSDRNKELQALRSELLHARQAIISANHIVKSTTEKIEQVSQTLAERNAQIQQMHQLIGEHELNTAARLKRLTLSIQRSLEEDTTIPRAIAPTEPTPPPAEPPIQSAPLTIEPDEAATSADTAETFGELTPVDLTPQLKRPIQRAASQSPVTSNPGPR